MLTCAKAGARQGALALLRPQASEVRPTIFPHIHILQVFVSLRALSTYNYVGKNTKIWIVILLTFFRTFTKILQLLKPKNRYKQLIISCLTRIAALYNRYTLLWITCFVSMFTLEFY